MSVDLRIGDCREILPTLPAESVHCCVTSPPYWDLRDYGHAAQIGLEPTIEAFVGQLVTVFREVRRVLRDDGTLWLNLGDAYCGARGGGQGKNSAFYSRAAAKEGVRERNGDRIVEGLAPKDLIGIPWRVAFALQADGWTLRSDIIWAKPNPMPESVRDRPTKAHEYLLLLSKSERYYYDAKAIAEPAATGDARRDVVPDGWATGPGAHDAVSHSRRAKLPPKDAGRAEMGGRVAAKLGGGAGWREVGRPPMKNKRTVWSIPTEPTPEAHFATFPRKLVEPCVLAGCPPGGVVLDPFAGTGTVGRVAEDLGRHSLLIELSPEYARFAERKTAQLGLSEKPDERTAE